MYSQFGKTIVQCKIIVNGCHCKRANLCLLKPVLGYPDSGLGLVSV